MNFLKKTKSPKESVKGREEKVINEETSVKALWTCNEQGRSSKKACHSKRGIKIWMYSELYFILFIAQRGYIEYIKRDRPKLPSA